MVSQFSTIKCGLQRIKFNQDYSANTYTSSLLTSTGGPGCTLIFAEPQFNEAFCSLKLAKIAYANKEYVAGDYKLMVQ
jgi:hypothetical protein